jgi:hypothetical protein
MPPGAMLGDLAPPRLVDGRRRLTGGTVTESPEVTLGIHLEYARGFLEEALL